MKKIKAPIDEKNVCSDWIEGVFDECNCVWGDNCQAVGFVSSKPVYAFWSDNQLTWKVTNSNDTILSELKKRLQYYESEESDVYSEISTNTDSIVQLFYFKEDNMDYLEKGQQDYTEFCNMFDGQKWSDVDNIVRANNLSYGAEKPSDGNGLADINYKNILATIEDDDGIVRVNLQCEIYDNDENFIM